MDPHLSLCRLSIARGSYSHTSAVAHFCARQKELVEWETGEKCSFSFCGQNLFFVDRQHTRPIAQQKIFFFIRHEINKLESGEDEKNANWQTQRIFMKSPEMIQEVGS